jgi:hypothetical protein
VGIPNLEQGRGFSEPIDSQHWLEKDLAEPGNANGKGMREISLK